MITFHLDPELSDKRKEFFSNQFAHLGAKESLLWPNCTGSGFTRSTAWGNGRCCFGILVGLRGILPGRCYSWFSATRFALQLRA